MEITFESKFKFKSNQIIGLIDKNRYFINYLEKIGFTKNNIVVDKKKVLIKELGNFKKRISIVNNYLNDTLDLTVYQYMKYIIFTDMLDLKNYKKKIYDSLKIIGYQESYLDKKINSLSKTEKQWISFAIGLFSNPDMIVLDNFFKSFDLKNTKKMMRLLTQLTEQYNKIVVIYENSSDVIYSLSKYTFIIKNGELLTEGDTKDIFSNNMNYLLTNGVEIPKTVEFSYLVNEKKKVRLGYFKDVRDLIKDIYKKV